MVSPTRYRIPEFRAAGKEGVHLPLQCWLLHCMCSYRILESQEKAITQTMKRKHISVRRLNLTSVSDPLYRVGITLYVHPGEDRLRVINSEYE